MSWTLILILASSYAYSSAVSIGGYSSKEKCEAIGNVLKSSNRFNHGSNSVKDAFCVAVK